MALNLGINGVIAFILYIYMQNTFRLYREQTSNMNKGVEDERKRNDNNIEKLCLRIDSLVSLINEQNINHTKRESDIGIMKDQYIRLSNKIEKVKDKVEEVREITNSCKKGN